MARARVPQLRLALAATVAAGILIAGVGTVGWRWYRYVTAGDTPYDEVGIEVNLRLPEPLRAWGCARIKERFPRALPPYGCQLGQISSATAPDGSKSGPLALRAPSIRVRHDGEPAWQ